MPAASAPLLSVRKLCKAFTLPRGHAGDGDTDSRIIAADNITFDLESGQTLGIVGESGSGKSTLARLILRLIEPDSGEVRFDGTDITTLAPRRLRRMRRDMQLIFQDPGGSLNRRHRVGEIIAEPMRVHRLAHGKTLRESVATLLETCGLPADAATRFPHEFSGGQKQRIAIARAIALRPRLLICDEPTSALDVSVQSQILNLLLTLQRDLNMAILFISHDMAVVEHMCERIIVMRRGKVVERGSRESLIGSPQEPYTQQLLEAVPRL